MAKKYLLYIHDERFEQETKKSGLVNELLAKHYDGLPVAFKDNVSAGTSKSKKKTEEKKYDFCQHNQVKGFCKHGC